MLKQIQCIVHLSSDHNKYTSEYLIALSHLKRKKRLKEEEKEQEEDKVRNSEEEEESSGGELPWKLDESSEDSMDLT